MKKIMFNDKYELTKAVLEGRKTQTRRIINPQPMYDENVGICWKGYAYGINFSGKEGAYNNFISGTEYDKSCKRYRVGEIVAVAQSYKTIDDYYKSAYSYNHSAHGMTVCEFDGVSDKDVHEWNMIAVNYRGKKVWTNKLFVKPELMLHFIRITNVRIERLQDISDDDCLAEGVELNTRQYKYDGTKYYCVRGLGHWRSFGCDNYKSPREAYAALIDKVGKKGDWESNPYVFVYDFELIK